MIGSSMLLPKLAFLQMQIAATFYIVFLSTSFAARRPEGQLTDFLRRGNGQVSPDVIPLTMQLKSASVNYQTNGMVRYEIQVGDAADGTCFFIFEDVADVTTINEVTKNNDVITGMILMREIPKWLYFSCYDNNRPVGVRYMLNSEFNSNHTTLTETRGNVNCKFSSPIHSTQGIYSIIDIEASCDHELEENNARVSLQGIELENGQVSYTGDFYSAFNETMKYENGVIKTKFAAPQDILNGLDAELTFTLTLQDREANAPVTRTIYVMLYDKSFDGSKPAVSSGTVAMQVFPSETDIIYVRRGAKTRLTCEAYGNPRPTVTWYKGSRVQIGQSDISFGNWNKYYAYQFLILKDFDSENEGDYRCRAEGENKFEERTKTLKLCDPVNIQFSYNSDSVMVNAAFEANQNVTNRIQHYSCFRSSRPFIDTWISEYRDPSVTVVNNYSDTYFRADITWRRGDGVTIPHEMYCKFFATCQMDGAVYKMNI